MTPRIRRLRSDYERIQKSFADHKYIKLVDCEGEPPEKYTLEFTLTGLVFDGDRPVIRVQPFRAELFLPRDYPRLPPFCRMITPIYHPNIDPQKICVGDHWSAGESLAHLIARIGEMICYQSYNIKSPLNGAAAAWAVEHMADLPLDSVDLRSGL